MINVPFGASRSRQAAIQSASVDPAASTWDAPRFEEGETLTVPAL